MLVLTRRIGEKIRIGTDVWIEVTRVVGNRVTLGIQAPPDIRIIRDELVVKDPPENQQSRESA
jgi:carbon storage regulator